MAQIRGIAIKGLKEFKGHEGETLLQGDIYFKGKKVGYYSDDFRGGMAVVDIDVKVQHEMYQLSEGYETKYTNRLENLIYEVVMLTDLEKTFTKAVKKGYVGIADVRGGFSEDKMTMYHDRILYIPRAFEFLSHDIITKRFKEYLEKENIHYSSLTLYRCKEDFIKS
jgi:glutaredoxin-related protein